MKVIKRRRGVGRHDGMTIIPGKALALLVHYVNHQRWQLWPGALHGPGGILNFRRIVIIPPAFRRSGCCSATAMNEFLVGRSYKGRFIEKSAVQRDHRSGEIARAHRIRGDRRAQYESRSAPGISHFLDLSPKTRRGPRRRTRRVSPRPSRRMQRPDSITSPDPLRRGPDANDFA